MNLQFLAFKASFREYIAWSIRDVEKVFPGFDRKNLVYWQKKGHIRKIRNGWYCFSDQPLHEGHLVHIANRIYGPSYLSLESALSYYGFIPEGVFMQTSVTTLRTQAFSTPLGHFRYQTLKPDLFFGYSLKQVDQTWYKVAYPEKALIDYFYLHPELKTVADLDSLRLNPLEITEQVDRTRLHNYLTYIDSAVLHQRFSLLDQYLHAFSE